EVDEPESPSAASSYGEFNLFLKLKPVYLLLLISRHSLKSFLLSSYDCTICVVAYRYRIFEFSCFVRDREFKQVAKVKPSPPPSAVNYQRYTVTVTVQTKHIAYQFCLAQPT